MSNDTSITPIPPTTPNAPKLPPQNRKKLTPAFERVRKDMKEEREASKYKTQKLKSARQLKFDY